MKIIDRLKDNYLLLGGLLVVLTGLVLAGISVVEVCGNDFETFSCRCEPLYYWISTGQIP